MDLERNIPNEDISEASLIRSLRRQGYSESKIVSYLRGWRMVGNKGVKND